MNISSIKTLFLCILGVFILNSCEESPCDKYHKEDYERPALSEDYLKWVKVSDTNPLFKVTYYDNSGNIDEIDTLKGYYKLELKEQQFILDDCAPVRYNLARNTLYLKLKINENFKLVFTMDNSVRKDGFTANVVGYISKGKELLETVLLDTATVNGKFYNEVFKWRGSSMPNDFYYYAKGVGFLYISPGCSIQKL